LKFQDGDHFSRWPPFCIYKLVLSPKKIINSNDLNELGVLLYV